jgi:hypothetical protein
MEGIEDRRLTEENIGDIVCCPGGLEVKDQPLKGELDRTVTWRKEMFKLGMEGFISYHDGIPRGFIEYMPAEVAPFPFEAPGAAVLMCYHWCVVNEGDEDEHLGVEKRLIQLVIDAAKGNYTGLVTFGWDNPSHFPIGFLKGLGFEEVEKTGFLSLMWLSFDTSAPKPKIPPSRFAPQDLSSEGLLVIEAAQSNRCSYTIHNNVRLEKVVEELPEGVKSHVRYFTRRIDTHEEAIKHAVSPWDWGWCYFNGQDVPIFKLPSEKIRERILDEVSKLTG